MEWELDEEVLMHKNVQVQHIVQQREMLGCLCLLSCLLFWFGYLISA